MLHTVEMGPRESQAAVAFLHGFALDGRMWAPQTTALAPTHRTLAIDLPGFGRSRYVEGHTPMVAEILTVLDVRSIERAHLVGASLGAAVAVDLALMHGDRVRSLVLADPLLLGFPAPPPSWERSVELAKAGDVKGAIEHWLADASFDGARTRPAVWTQIREMVGGYDGGHWTGASRLRWASRQPGERLAQLRVPTLVLAGEHDPPGFQAMADEYARAIPGARQQRIPGAGHVSNLEEPETFTRLLREFWTSL